MPRQSEASSVNAQWVFHSDDVINGWLTWMILFAMLICHLAYLLGKPGHYRLRHQRPAERLTASGRPPTPGKPAQGRWRGRKLLNSKY